jgi:hypothetical protein
MGFVRAWARRNRRRFILLPHGVRFYYGHECDWDADRIGVLGRQSRDALVNSQPELAGRLFLAGGLHLAAQGRTAQVGERGSEGTGPWRACLLVSGHYVRNYPDSLDEVRDDLRALAGALGSRGGCLRVRLHPRDHDTPLYRILLQDPVFAGLPLETSDPGSSLRKDLEESAAAVIRLWGGAGIVALYAGIPLVGWVPRCGAPESRSILRRLPLCAAKPEDLAETVHRLVESESRRSEVVAAQRAFLEELIERPFDEPFGFAAEAVLREVDQALGGAEAGRGEGAGGP